ncbi:MAG: hypothetical protein ACO32J_09045, partial [Phycisphaerales bacterium]
MHCPSTRPFWRRRIEYTLLASLCLAAMHATAVAQTAPPSPGVPRSPMGGSKAPPTSPPPASTPPVEPPVGTEPAPSEPAPVEPAPADVDAPVTEPSQPVTPPSLEGAGNPDAARQQARNAMAAGRWSEAVDAWTVVLNADPSDAEAKSGLENCQAQMGQTPLLDAVAEQDSLMAQRMTVQFESAMIRAGEKLQSGDYVGAQQDVATAQAVLDRARNAV